MGTVRIETKKSVLRSNWCDLSTRSSWSRSFDGFRIERDRVKRKGLGGSRRRRLRNSSIEESNSKRRQTREVDECRQVSREMPLESNEQRSEVPQMSEVPMFSTHTYHLSLILLIRSRRSFRFLSLTNVSDRFHLESCRILLALVSQHLLHAAHVHCWKPRCHVGYDGLHLGLI